MTSTRQFFSYGYSNKLKPENKDGKYALPNKFSKETMEKLKNTKI